MSHLIDFRVNDAVMGENGSELRLTAPGKVHATVKVVREAFSGIEQSHPDTPPAPLTVEILRAKLALTFQPEMVNRLLAVLDGRHVVAEPQENVGTVPSEHEALEHVGTALGQDAPSTESHLYVLSRPLIWPVSKPIWGHWAR